MALDKKLAQAPEEQQSDPGGDLDMKIAVLMGMRLLDDGGFEVIDRAVESSKDPGQVIGQFLLQMGQQLYEKMPEDLKFSPDIMLAEGGWVEQISDYIQAELGVAPEVMNKAEIYVAHAATQMAQNKAAPAAADAVQAGQPGPAMPPQGAV